MYNLDTNKAHQLLSFNKFRYIHLIQSLATFLNFICFLLLSSYYQTTVTVCKIFFLACFGASSFKHTTALPLPYFSFVLLTINQEQWDDIISWFKYKEYPSSITEREEKKAWKKKMKKYKFQIDKNLLFYHANNIVCFSNDFMYFAY